MKRTLITVFLTLFSVILYAQENPYVLLISFDGFRWDYCDRGVSPNLIKMKNEGVSALSLRPTYPSKTFPNHISIITGMYPENHGIIANSFSDPCTQQWYSTSDTLAKSDSKWYLGEMFWETAERYGIKTASYFWPASSISEEGRHPTYFHNYDHARPYEKRIQGIIDWLKLPYANRPHFLTLYFDHTDTWGHNYGPNSDKILFSISHLDSLIGKLYDGFKSIGMEDSINVIVVSDHGMTEISNDRVVNIDSILTGLHYHMEGSEPFAFIEPSEEDYEKVLETLAKHENHYALYTKESIPDHFHFSNHPFIRPIILVANLGWTLTQNSWLEKKGKYSNLGNHGYDNNHIDMHGIFIADGPAFKNGYTTGTLWNIDIYPLLAKIFGIHGGKKIDGKLERISQVLK